MLPWGILRVGKQQKGSSRLKEQSSNGLEQEKQSSSLVGVKCQEGKMGQQHPK